MKTQAWGWLAAAVVAAALNASYHDGGLQWAHRLADRAEHRVAAVLALATGHADRFVSEARLVSTHDATTPCRLATALARVQTNVAQSEISFSRFEVMSAREQAQLARLSANRERIQARIEAQTAHLRIPPVPFNPVVLAVPKVPACPRTRISIPSPPTMNMHGPVIHIQAPDGGTV